VTVLPPWSPDELAELWRLMLEGHHNADDFDYYRLGEASVGFTPRELETVQTRMIDEFIADPQFDPDDLPTLTTEDYLHRLDAADPEQIPWYVDNLDRTAVEQLGLRSLTARYDEWQERFTVDSDP
jgi:transitional endoplasmic reticulum ATPase